MKKIKQKKSKFGLEFLAKKLTTSMEWDDLILPHPVMEQINEIKIWIENEKLINKKWGLAKMIKPGYRTLFHGASGTGKTLTATLIGKMLSKDVYRIDLPTVISKFIGETEKNLHSVFKKAEDQGWILFFDEADALFGKRTQTSSSNDRYANIEVSYLLQRIEDYSGLVILSSNLKENIDEAFMRCFQSIIHFPMPNAEQRLQLWQNAFSMGLQISPDVDLIVIANDHELTGGDIINVLQRLAIRAAGGNSNTVEMKDILASLRDELRKNGKAISS